MTKYGKLYIFCDGSSLGNPGQSGSGCIARDANGYIAFKRSRHIGDNRTNNEAEFDAIALALENANGITNHVKIISDAQIAIKGLNGEWNIKSSNLIPFVHKIQSLEKKFDEVIYEFRHREENMEADALANVGSRIKEKKDMSDYKD